MGNFLRILLAVSFLLRTACTREDQTASPVRDHDREKVIKEIIFPLDYIVM